LNIKGKSAKKNRLSGFVPFVQISDNDHKKLIEDSPPQARTHMYFRNETACEKALRSLQKTLDALIKEAPHCMQVRHAVLTKVAAHANMDAHTDTAGHVSDLKHYLDSIVLALLPGSQDLSFGEVSR
jgi:predicted class III extradiol MEMO1 family dioxygenase